jgi:hypothetical protein
MNTLLHTDPALLELAWSLSVGALAMLASAIALVALPWTDAEIAAVDDEARLLVRPALRRATTMIR